MLKGSTTPRIYTAAKRDLTPETSLGFAVVEFAKTVLKEPLLPWQEWLAIHALEIEGDLQGSWRFRYRTVLVLVARQQGKTHLSKVIASFFLWMLGVNLAIGTSTNLEAAEEVWEGVVALAEDVPELSEEVERVYRSAGNKTLTLTDRRRYKVTTSNRKGARGKSGDLVLLDELREHQTWEAWSAVSKTTMARPNALIWCMSNAGDASSVVLRSLRAKAHAQLGDPDGVAKEAGMLGNPGDDDVDDDSLGIFEWSAPVNADIHDHEAWAQANPSLGYGFVTERALASACATDPEDVFKTECLCQWVTAAIQPPFAEGAWEAGIRADSKIAPDSVLTFGVDVSADRQHASIAVCGQRADGNWHGEVIAYRNGLGWLPDAISVLASKQPADVPLRVALQAKGAPVSSVLDGIAAVDGVEIIPCQGRDVAGWCGRLWDAVDASNPNAVEPSDSVKLFHISQPRLDIAANTAVTHPMGDGAWAWDRVKSTEEISPLVALTMAFGAATQVEEPEEPVKVSAYASHDVMFI